MRPRSRLRKTVKWGGLALAGAVAVLWALAARRPWMLHQGAWRAWGAHGAVVFDRQAARVENGVLIAMPGKPIVLAGIAWAKPTLEWGVRIRRRSGWINVHVPLWPAALACAAAGAWAWRLDALASRRARAGRCPKCGYDRAGLPATTPPPPCPECGAGAR